MTKKGRRKVLLKATVLHEGWETDNTLEVIEEGGKRTLITTSHGSPCAMSRKELQAKIQETAASLRQLRLASNIMGW